MSNVHTFLYHNLQIKIALRITGFFIQIFISWAKHFRILAIFSSFDLPFLLISLINQLITKWYHENYT